MTIGEALVIGALSVLCLFWATTPRAERVTRVTVLGETSTRWAAEDGLYDVERAR